MFDTLFAESGLTLDKLRMLVEVHDAGSIAKAAPDNPTRQAQFSRQLRELSAFLGCEVAERSGKELKMTVSGHELVEMARQFLSRLEDFNADCKKQSVEFVIGGGDSLIHWLVIPKVGSILGSTRDIRLSTVSMRTKVIIQQVLESQLDFGLVRKNAVTIGLSSKSLGTLSYVAVVPKERIKTGKRPDLAEVFRNYPMAMQASDGEYTATLRGIASKFAPQFQACLTCQSFPQVFAAVKSGRFAAILPELAVGELSSKAFEKITGPEMRALKREICLVWNPRMTKIRTRASDLVKQVQTALAF